MTEFIVDSMNPWVHAIFSGVIVSLLGAGFGSLGTWLAFRLSGWQRWAAIALAVAGFIFVYLGLAAVVKRFDSLF